MSVTTCNTVVSKRQLQAMNRQETPLSTQTYEGWQADLWGQPGLQSYSQDSQGHTKIPVSKN